MNGLRISKGAEIDGVPHCAGSLLPDDVPATILHPLDDFDAEQVEAALERAGGEVAEARGGWCGGRRFRP